MRLLAILVALVLVQSENSALWAEFGNWADPFTWLIWLSPCPIVWDSPNTCEVSHFFRRIIRSTQP